MLGTRVNIYGILFTLIFFYRVMSNESAETNVLHRRNKTNDKPFVLPQSENLSSRQSIPQWFASFFTYGSPKKVDITLNNENKNEHKRKSTKWSCLCNHLFCKLFLLFCGIYFIMYMRPDYSIYLRNSFGAILKKYNLTAQEFQLRPGQRLAHSRQPSMPIIIIPGIISTGLELWQGLDCAKDKFRHRFWTSMQMVDNIGRDHQCWLKHISLNLSTWYVKINKTGFSNNLFYFLHLGKILSLFVFDLCLAGLQLIMCT
jgi:hypothetical protein